ncbi:MAG TPA: NAD(+)/NADH kinase [Candidatus Acidoferrales bacterium]|jgi:NAD+ kinase|nr:NAD(+)/NADH kinase [Candidatus Acidoferrales bacterium]
MIKTVGIISRPRREDVARVVPPLVNWLQAHGAKVICDSETGDCIQPLAAQTKKREDIPESSDLLIVLGGDGTLLSAARLTAECGVPVLAVNLGGLGFLTTVPQDEIYSILEELFEGKHRVSERVMLDAEIIRAGNVIRRQTALNDAVLNKAALARIMDLELRVDGEYVTTYKSDGLIISTPTGSTAYSLAAGGPIVYPSVEAFVVSPICPHTLTNRPIVIPDSATIEIDFKAEDDAVFLTLDGQIGIELVRGDHIRVRKAANKLMLVRPARKTYYQILRSKLKWGER